MADSINVAVPTRRWSRPYAVTLSNTLTDRNLEHNGVPFLFIQNIGTAGKVMIAWAPDDTLVDIYLGAGEVLEGGIWRHAKILATTVGVDLRGFLGMASALR